MVRLADTAAARRCTSRRFRSFRLVLSAAALALAALGFAQAQPLDCAGLRAKIAALDQASAARPNRYAAAAHKQRAELDRTAAYARSLGCNQPEIPIFGPPRPARCQGLEAKIAQMQANLGGLEAAATTDTDRARHDLMARYDAYCRAPMQARPQAGPQNFFEALFGAFVPNQPVPQAPQAWPPSQQPEPLEDERETGPHGGSQAVCVRSCDGGFFPLHVSARHADEGYLGDLCRALCPNTDARVFTKGPYSEIQTAVALDDGAPYSDLPNALKFQASYDAACTCKPASQSWAQALAPAEEVLAEGRRSDLVVTPEASERLSQAQPAPQRKATGRGRGETPRGRPEGGDAAAIPPAAAAPGRASSAAAATEAPPAHGAKEVVGPDGVKRRVRIIAPTL